MSTAALLLSLALVADPPANPSAERPPNVVLVLVDDLGWSDGACLGSKYYETPNLDRLAAEGVRFTQAYAACAVCSPTRAALLTGRHPARVGITDWIHHAGPEAEEAQKVGRNLPGYDRPRNRPLLTPRNKVWLEDEELTIAELLKPLGYATCHVGKWHLGPEGHGPETQGFDENHGGCRFGHPPSYFDPYSNERWEGIPHLPPRAAGEYLTDREADEAVDFIERNAERPFFLYLAHYAVHSPIQAPDELVAKYAAKEPTNHREPKYAAMVEGVDRALGRVLEALDRLELADETLVVYTSDNGGAAHFPATDNAPLRSGKGFPYEGGLRVPLVVRWPGEVRAGATVAEPVISMDLLPTIAAAAGAELPDDRQLDGLSLWPVLREGAELERDELVWHFPHYWWGTRVEPYSVLRAGSSKLVVWSGPPVRWELYDLDADPSEGRDLVAEGGEELERAGHLFVVLSTALERMGARTPRSNPDYEER